MRALKYAPPGAYALPDFVALVYWKSGDLELADQLGAMIKDWDNTDWKASVELMRTLLANDTNL